MIRKKRVLLPVHVFFPDHYFGTETYTLELALQLKSSGLEPVILTTTPQGEKGSGKIIDDYEFSGLKCYVIDLNLMRITRFKESYYHPRLASVLEDVIKKIDPDIAHVTHLINHSAVLLEVLHKRNIPAIATFTDFFGICFNNKLERYDGVLCSGPNKRSTNCLCCYMKRAQGFPFEKTVKKVIGHNSALRCFSSCLPWLIKIPGFRSGPIAGHILDVTDRMRKLKVLYDHYQYIIAPSQFLYDAYQQNGFYPERLRKINFGIDLASTKNYRCQKKIDSNHRIQFGFIGQIMAHKGVDLLLDAFNQIDHSNADLIVYGPKDQDSQYMNTLNQLADLNGRIVFRPAFPREQLSKRLSEIDVLVIPSRWYENSPLVLLYSLANKTPVIVTDVKGMTEFVQDGENGYVFKMNDVDQLAAAMSNIVRQPHLIETLSSNARYEMDVSDHADQVLTLYEDIFSHPTQN